jgi:hypothetical protein
MLEGSRSPKERRTDASVNSPIPKPWWRGWLAKEQFDIVLSTNNMRGGNTSGLSVLISGLRADLVCALPVEEGRFEMGGVFGKCASFTSKRIC